MVFKTLPVQISHKFVKSFCKNINHITKKFINTFPKVLTTLKKSKTTKQTVKLNYFVFFKITTWNSWFKVSSDIKLRTEEETYLLPPASLRVISSKNNSQVFCTHTHKPKAVFQIDKYIKSYHRKPRLNTYQLGVWT